MEPLYYIGIFKKAAQIKVRGITQWWLGSFLRPPKWSMVAHMKSGEFPKPATRGPKNSIFEPIFQLPFSGWTLPFSPKVLVPFFSSILTLKNKAIKKLPYSTIMEKLKKCQTPFLPYFTTIIQIWSDKGFKNHNKPYEQTKGPSNYTLGSWSFNFGHQGAIFYVKIERIIEMSIKSLRSGPWWSQAESNGYGFCEAPYLPYICKGLWLDMVPTMIFP